MGQHLAVNLAYFGEHITSGPVEGLNNKDRVITKRCYGVKDTKTLWNLLCLDVFRSSRRKHDQNHVREVNVKNSRRKVQNVVVKSMDLSCGSYLAKSNPYLLCVFVGHQFRFSMWR